MWSGPGIRTFTATGDRVVQADQPTLFEIWVCADGYWCDHTKLLCPGDLRDDYRELEHGLMGVYERAIDHCRPGASFAELDRLVREGIAADESGCRPADGEAPRLGCHALAMRLPQGGGGGVSRADAEAVVERGERAMRQAAGALDAAPLGAPVG